MSNQIKNNFSLNKYLVVITALCLFSTYFFLIGRYNLSIFLILVFIIFSSWYFYVFIEVLIPHFSGVKKFFYKKHLFFINTIAIVLLLVSSPILSFIWLFCPSLYFLYKQNYKDFFLIWSILFFIWYTIFTFIFNSFGPVIIIGGSHTNDLLNYLLLNQDTMWFSGLCYQTVYIFDLISQKIGCLILIPTLFFSPKKTSCMDKKPTQQNQPEPRQKKDSTNPNQNKGGFGSFGMGRTREDIVRKDYDQCMNMVPNMKQQSWNVFSQSATEVSKDGTRIVTASSTYIPFVDTFVKCNGRSLTSVEQEVKKFAEKK